MAPAVWVRPQGVHLFIGAGCPFARRAATLGGEEAPRRVAVTLGRPKGRGFGAFCFCGLCALFFVSAHFLGSRAIFFDFGAFFCMFEPKRQLHGVPLFRGPPTLKGTPTIQNMTFVVVVVVVVVVVDGG